MPDLEGNASIARMLGIARLIRKMRELAQLARSKRAERLGWGLCSTVTTYEFKGETRPLWLAYASAVCVSVVALYGLAKHYRLVARDVRTGVRCAPCTFEPATYFGTIAATGFVLWAISLGGSHFMTRQTHNWGFLGAHECEGRFVYRIKSWQCCIVYEIVQFAVTIVGIVSWSIGVHNVALIDIPHDRMHLMYIHYGHPNFSKEHPSPRHGDHNPLGVRGGELGVFHGLEFFVMSSVALHAVTSTAWRIVCDRTMYKAKLWMLLDVAEIGMLVSCAYPRIFDHWRWYGSKMNGYSPFILFGFFRFLRMIRFERLVYLLFSYDGLKLPFFQCNGTYVRYYMLLLKLFVGLASIGAVVCAVEYPCEPNAIRLDKPLQLEECNDWFKRYDQCIYFLVVTMATIGFGDMYPATIEGRVLMILILLFVLSIFPALSAHLRELSDGDDMSQEDYIISCVVAIWEELAHVNTKLGEIITKFKSAAMTTAVLANQHGALVDQSDITAEIFDPNTLRDLQTSGDQIDEAFRILDHIDARLANFEADDDAHAVLR
ncbi:hypothetical protein CTAYLR_002211 [Chrysophaeum taylorii]|uniref:Potassium channel domain-containing protein n=1 Tax=Chrysophaeum taylorii TaxID=2483200 RepID=A0AAD7UPU6_9STRA|nr:hypothetical protein CTAYLR_002211 [Chrysophaeum taylorii]